MTFPTVEEETKPLPTASTEAAFAVLDRLGNARTRGLTLGRPRDVFSCLWVLVACSLWFFAFRKLGVADEALPWYLTVGAIGTVCARNAVRSRATELDFDWLPKTAREPITFLESWTIAYFVASLALYLWIAFQPPIPKQQAKKLVQFVDIQLVSHADAVDRGSLLPATKQATQQHRRDSDRITQQGSLSAAAPPKQQPQKQEKQNPAKPIEKQTSPQRKQSADAAAMVAPHAKGPQPAPQPKQSQQGRAMLAAVPTNASPAQKPDQSKSQPDQKQSRTWQQRSTQQPLIEEVQPPEMVEMVENDGSRQAFSNFENGGNSTGGSGAQNALQAYIKELHKRIKNSWQPPRGESRKAQVLFRIRKDGRLSFIRVTASSGDNETDTAAIRAVESAVAGKSLPNDYPLPYLDVQYNFNYTADELKEIKVRIN